VLAAVARNLGDVVLKKENIKGGTKVQGQRAANLEIRGWANKGNNQETKFEEYNATQDINSMSKKY